MKIAIIGASGHGKVVFDALSTIIEFEIRGFIDDNFIELEKTLLGVPILGDIDFLMKELTDEIEGVFVAIGNNNMRKAISERILDKFELVNAIHQKSIISEHTKLGKGVLVVAGAIINSSSTISDGAIINTGATVDHDNFIGEYTHIAPGVHLAGNVKIGNLSFIGMGTLIIQNIEIGSNVTIGAGSIVIRDLPDNCLAYGVPAKIKNKLKNK